MKLWEHPRLTGALCAAAVLACAAMPAAFLAVTDAAYIGRVVPVAEPYTAPTPAADDYYILRQLAARRQDSAELPRAEEPTAPGTPKMYIGASASLESMNYADAATADAAEQALQRLADCGVLPGVWAAQQDTAAEEDSYTDYDGRWYDLSAAFCATDSLGFVTVRRYTLQGDMLLTRSASRWTAAPAQWWRSGSRCRPGTLRRCLCPMRPPCAPLQPRPGWKASAIGPYPPTAPTAAPSAVKTAGRSSRPRPTPIPTAATPAQQATGGITA